VSATVGDRTVPVRACSGAGLFDVWASWFAICRCAIQRLTEFATTAGLDDSLVNDDCPVHRNLIATFGFTAAYWEPGSTPSSMTDHDESLERTAGVVTLQGGARVAASYRSTVATSEGSPPEVIPSIIGFGWTDARERAMYPRERAAIGTRPTQRSRADC
jgi:hypothetical protein